MTGMCWCLIYMMCVEIFINLLSFFIIFIRVFIRVFIRHNLGHSNSLGTLKVIF